MYLHYLWYSSRCVDDSRKNIKDLIYCLTLVVANDVNSNLFDINYMVMVIFQFCYSGMYAPTRILLICEVSVHLMKIYFCETNKKTTCFITTEPVKFKTWRQEDAGTIYRNVSSLNHSYFFCAFHLIIWNVTVPLTISFAHTGLRIINQFFKHCLFEIVCFNFKTSYRLSIKKFFCTETTLWNQYEAMVCLRPSTHSLLMVCLNLW